MGNISFTQALRIQIIDIYHLFYFGVYRILYFPAGNVSNFTKKGLKMLFNLAINLLTSAFGVDHDSYCDLHKMMVADNQEGKYDIILQNVDATDDGYYLDSRFKSYLIDPECDLKQETAVQLIVDAQKKYGMALEQDNDGQYVLYTGIYENPPTNDESGWDNNCE